MSKALLEAADSGNLEEVQKLLAEKDLDIHYKNEQGKTAIILAAKKITMK